MGQTAIVSPQIVDSTTIGRDLITAADQAAAQAIIGVTGVDTGDDYNWTGDHVFEAGIEATTYSFTAGGDGNLSHPDLASSIYVRFNNADVFRFNALDFWPVSTGTKNLGRSDHRWANVYSVAGAFSGTVTANAFVGDGSGLTNLPAGNPFDQDLNTTDSPSFADGDFSGTVTTPNVTGTSNLYLQNSTNTSSISIAASGVITVKANNSTVQQFLSTGVSYRLPCIPTFDGTINLGLDTNRWGATYSVDGSFSGNLNTEVGGSQRVYNLGTEGDTDTEYLETSFTANVATISAKATGSGVVRDLNFSGHDGDFSGDVIMAANVDFTGLPTADPVVAGRLWNDSGTLKISAG